MEQCLNTKWQKGVDIIITQLNKRSFLMVEKFKILKVKAIKVVLWETNQKGLKTSTCIKLINHKIELDKVICQTKSKTRFKTMLSR